MSDTPEQPASESAPRALRIRFVDGERPHLFWLATSERDKITFKVLSKRDRQSRIVVLVVEDAGRARRVLAHRSLPLDVPSGWLSQWVARLERDLMVRFRCYDLRHVQTKEEWVRTVKALGWLRDSEGEDS